MHIQNVNSVVLGLFPWPAGPCIRCILIHLWVYITEGCRQTQCPPQVHTGTDILEGKHWISILFAWVFLLYKKIIDICRSIATDYFLHYLALKHWLHSVFSSIQTLIQASRGGWSFPFLQKLARATKTKHIISLFHPFQIIKVLYSKLCERQRLEEAHVVFACPHLCVSSQLCGHYVTTWTNISLSGGRWAGS